VSKPVAGRRARLEAEFTASFVTAPSSVSSKLSRVDWVSASQHDHPFPRADSVDGKKGQDLSLPAEEATATNDDLVRAVSVSFVADAIKPADLVAVVAKNAVALGRCKQATEVSLASETGSLDALFGHMLSSVTNASLTTASGGLPHGSSGCG
jgi:hypothetical protein